MAASSLKRSHARQREVPVLMVEFCLLPIRACIKTQHTLDTDSLPMSAPRGLSARACYASEAPSQEKAAGGEGTAI